MVSSLLGVSSKTLMMVFIPSVMSSSEIAVVLPNNSERRGKVTRGDSIAFGDEYAVSAAALCFSAVFSKRVTFSRSHFSWVLVMF